MSWLAAAVEVRRSRAARYNGVMVRLPRCVVSFFPLTLVGVALLLGPAPASAQTFGVRVGASADPDQFFFGGHFESQALVDRLHFRPNVEVGIGDGATLAGLNFEFAYKFASRRRWNVYAGAGPALNLLYTARRDRAEGGFNLLLGVEHRRGLFGEIKLGAIDSPDFKITVGYVLR